MNLPDYFQKSARGKSAEMAKSLNIQLSKLSAWKANKVKVPFQKCLEIETMTNGEVTCEELRPDVNWQEWSVFFENRKSRQTQNSCSLHTSKEQPHD